VWGLAFKPNTNDMREAPSRALIEALWAAGARVQAFDPVAMDEARRIYGPRDDLVLGSNKYAVLEGADALVICTEWQQFRAPDFDLSARCSSMEEICMTLQGLRAVGGNMKELDVDAGLRLQLLFHQG
jgi:UDP-glucose 6-dehydrogenase